MNQDHASCVRLIPNFDEEPYFDPHLFVQPGGITLFYNTHWDRPDLMSAEREAPGVWAEQYIDGEGGKRGDLGAAMDSSGTFHIAYRFHSGVPTDGDYGGEVRLAVGRGDSWSLETVATDVDPYCVNLALGPSRETHVLFVSGPWPPTRLEEHGAVVHAVRRDDGGEWVFTTLDPDVTQAQRNCAIAVDGSGIAHAMWISAEGAVRYANNAGDGRDRNCDGAAPAAASCP